MNKFTSRTLSLYSLSKRKKQFLSRFTHDGDQLKPFEAEIYLFCCELEGGFFLADYHRPNVLTDYHETWRIIGRWGGTVSRGKVAASRLSGAIHHMGRLDIFLPPLPLHLHLEPRLFAEVNAAECRCPREPPRARETPTASHILRMKTFTTILARATPPTPSFPSRGQRPMMSLFLRVLPLPFFLIPPLSFPYFIRGNFVVFSFFFRFRTRGSYRSLLSFFRGGRKEFSVSSSLERIETNDRYSVMLIQVGYTIFSFRLVLLEFQSRRDIIKKRKKMRRKRMQ